jgi:hypothetical protein
MWDYKKKKIDNIKQIPKDCFGFVYLITNLTNDKKYIGCKQLFTKRKRKFGKRELAALTDKRLKKYELVIKEGNWLTYTGSNKLLNADIVKGHKIKKQILWYASSKLQLTYLETRELFSNTVLESPLFYNDNILGKFYTNSIS